ncbi:cyclophilin-like fold protein [Xanthobacter sp. TB0136]|uniref:cyclophilin-like fold protein n=1 Tax=Xanthobacter sp. TB0136 TaxID=3459177 RepID=UPI004039F969
MDLTVTADPSTITLHRKGCYVLRSLLGAAILALGLSGPAMAQERIRISSEWGEVTAVLADNAAAKALADMLPLTVAMTDHLRQEKTGNLPSPLPEIRRQQEFSVGTLGLWSRDHFVIYYRGGRVPQPGIVILGQVSGNVSIFDRPGPITVRLQKAK